MKFLLAELEKTKERYKETDKDQARYSYVYDKTIIFFQKIISIITKVPLQLINFIICCSTCLFILHSDEEKYFIRD